ncbi:benzoylformate decarboxylase [Saccharothrix obliqua]|uniref:benzoylformate decarboxylase n=1 Tax=Saccharothrix obliqua TaxID=2861747 RepID=UPI001C5D0487|nr:benzoylformate decarboxylase [Saccharothrix obliqua]MBW4717758.1 benzoylformate decarboxylase [Saccharothrix obliqua]
MSAEDTNFRTVREDTLEVFRQLGLTTVFSNPSHTEMKLFETWPDDFRFIMGLQEATVVGMADGYAQATGEPSLVVINGGPGTGNAMGSIYTAASAHTPMVIIGGLQARKLQQGAPFLNAPNATQLPQPYIKWAAEAARPQDVPALIEKAYHIAKQAPAGPVFIGVPEDDWIRPANSTPYRVRTVQPAVVPDPEVLGTVADVLNSATNPAVVAGPGVEIGGARRDLIKLAERLNARVYGSPVWPRGAFPENHPLFGGVLPPLAELINARLAEHDVVIVLGSPTFTLFTTADLFSQAPAQVDTSDAPKLPEGTRFIHVTDDPEAASWSMAGTAYVTPPAAFVRGLVPLLPQRQRLPLPALGEPLPTPTATTPITEPYLFHVLSQELPTDAQVFEELPIGRAPFHEQIPLGPDNGYFATASGALGFPFAGAVGYAVARPDQRVVVVVGEGSAQYTIHALWTAGKYNLPVTFVIPNNSGYLSLKYYLDETSQKAWQEGWDLSGVDMAQLARGFGVAGERVETPEQLQQALRRALTADGPVMLDVAVSDPGLFRL